MVLVIKVLDGEGICYGEKYFLHIDTAALRKINNLTEELNREGMKEYIERLKSNETSK